jgi:hypothetical protein
LYLICLKKAQHILSPEIQKLALAMIQALGVDGMSGAETDKDSPESLKRLYSIVLDWRDPEVTTALYFIDSYPDNRTPNAKTDQRGNKPLPRKETSLLVSTNALTAPRGLPANVYADSWIANLGDDNCAEGLVGAKEAITIPAIVRASDLLMRTYLLTGFSRCLVSRTLRMLQMLRMPRMLRMLMNKTSIIHSHQYVLL